MKEHAMNRYLSLHIDKTAWFIEYEYNDIYIYIGSGGNQLWLKNNRFHRENGPATVYKNGLEEYWVNGNYIKENKK